MKAGPHIRREYNQEIYGAKMCEAQIEALKNRISECERARDAHYAAAARWAQGTDIESVTNGENRNADRS